MHPHVDDCRCVDCVNTKRAEKGLEEMRAALGITGSIEQRRQALTEQQHYATLPIEPDAVADAWGLSFRVSEAVHYIARHRLKGTPVDDLLKAANRLISEAERLQNDA